MTLRSKFALLALSSMMATSAIAQTRDLGAQRIVLDDGVSPFRLTLVSPPLTADGTFTFPDPATTSGSFVMTASTTGQTISGPLSMVGSSTASLGVTPISVEVTGRDQVGSDFPFRIQTDNSALTYGVSTFGRMLRLEQTGNGFVDMGIDNASNFFITQNFSTAHALELSSTGDLNVAGNITLGGTVDGVDVSAADAQNVKLTGDQTLAGDKTFANRVALSPQGNFLAADGSFLTPTNSSINVASDDATPANRTFVIANGTIDGQVLVIRQEANASQLQDGGNAMLSADMDFGPGDTISLIWDTALNSWLETGRSDN